MAGATGTVVWSPTTKITMLTTVTSPPYADSSSRPATCVPGDSVAKSDPCFVCTCDLGDLECLPVQRDVRRLKANSSFRNSTGDGKRQLQITRHR
jgi:hypothetical protein